jgi:hypothetical protein
VGLLRNVQRASPDDVKLYLQDVKKLHASMKKRVLQATKHDLKIV